MFNYHFKFKSSAAKEFRKLPSQIKQRVAGAIERLIVNPRCSGVVKLKGDNDFFFDFCPYYIHQLKSSLLFLSLV